MHCDSRRSLARWSVSPPRRWRTSNRDHAVVSRDLRFDDFDQAIELSTELFARWFSKITGEGIAVDLLPSIPWQNVLRLRRRDLSVDNPETLGARVVYTLGEPAARELLEALERSEEDRAALIGRLYASDEARWLAELLIEIEEDPDDLVRLT